MLNFENAQLRRGVKILFDNANLRIHSGDRVGVVGRNGCGKSSLFKVFTGGLSTDSGEIIWPKNWRIALMAQELQSSDVSALDYVLAGDTLRSQLLIDLADADPEAQHNEKRIVAIHAELDNNDAWTAPTRATKLLSGLGFDVSEHSNKVTNFSGGWRVRLNLARALMMPSDLLLLDEPTNHLDIDAITWLENWLQAYRGTLLLVSHDRDFLDAATTKTLWFERKDLRLFNGNYESALLQKTEQLAQQQSEHEKQQAQIAHMQDFVRRFKAKASKAKQAQSRVKALERMQRVQAVRLDTPFTFSLPSTEKMSDPLLVVYDAAIGYGDNAIIENLNLTIRSGDRIGVLGVNGAGKSTLLKTLAAEIPMLSGERNEGEHLKIGYFAQHQMEALDLNASPLIQLKRLTPKATEQSIRTFLGSFNFQEEAVADSIHHFSGGEKARLALALIAWQKPNLLILDEPTNHLDMEVRDALLLAMQQFEGAVLLVSHDRYLLRHTVDDFWLVANGQVLNYDGDLADYQKHLSQINANDEPASSIKTDDNKTKRQQAAALRTQLAPLKKSVTLAEKSMAKIEPTLVAIEQRLADPSIYEQNNKDELKAVLKQQSELREAMEVHEIEWMDAVEQLEQAEVAYR
ncbi:MAG TPA: ATP-binding cassette domain-containing protein [Porticoccus sp.]|nr:ATP-binding cassette domain-containing protein [Porticoccus sp.]